MSKVIKLTESDIKKIVKRVLKEEKLNEQPIDIVNFIGKALGPKYSSKVEKAMLILMTGKKPTMGDLTELLSDVDIMDGMVIGPKLLECVNFCQKPSYERGPVGF